MIRLPAKDVKGINGEAPKFIHIDFDDSADHYKNNGQKIAFENNAISEIVALQALTIKDLRFSVKANLITSIILAVLLIGNLALRFL